MEESRYKLPPGSRVLITGATGFTGSVLLRKLVNQRVSVVAIARSTSNLEPFKGMAVEWLQGDIFDEQLIQQAVKNVNYIFHLASPFRDAQASEEDYYNLHVLSTQRLAQAALKQYDFKRFIYVSTVGVHGHLDNPPGDENSPLEAEDIYQKTKLEGETWIKEFAEKEQFPITIVRPGGIYGPGEQRLFKIYKWVAQKWVPVVGDGENLLQFIHVDDLTDFLILVALHPRAIRDVFICGSPGTITFQGMVDLIGDYYGVSPQFIKLPVAPTFALSRFCERIGQILKIDPPLYPRRLGFYTNNLAFKTSKMTELLEFVPRHSDQKGLQQLAQWYLDQGWISLKNIS